MDYKKIIEYLFDLGCIAKFRHQAETEWQQVLAISDFHGLVESDHNVEYELAYFAPPRCVDCSLVFYSKNYEPCAVLVLYLIEINGISYFSLAGRPIEPILFASNVKMKDRKRISKSLIRVLCDFSNNNNLGEFTCHGYNSDSGRSIDEWYGACAQYCDQIALNHQIYIDLHKSLDEIRSSFRKSYKPLIGKAEKLWESAVLGPKEITSEIWGEFKKLHFVVAGQRNTRSEKSWASQLLHIRSGKAFLITLRDGNHNLVGGGFFYYTRDHGSYATAAYDRSLFDKPLGHLTQWLAIKELKRLGVKLYTIGWLPFENSLPKPSKKDFSIGLFKSGFSDTVRIQFVFNFRSKTLSESFDKSDI
jgi:FemAB family protein